MKHCSAPGCTNTKHLFTLEIAPGPGGLEPPQKAPWIATSGHYALCPDHAAPIAQQYFDSPDATLVSYDAHHDPRYYTNGAATR